MNQDHSFFHCFILSLWYGIRSSFSLSALSSPKLCFSWALFLVLPPMAANSTIEDSFKSLFLHPSNHPGLILVSQVLTIDKWQLSFTEESMNAKNKLGFVNGSIPWPEGDSDAHALARLHRSNDIVSSWILNSVWTDIILSIIYSAAAIGQEFMGCWKSC